MDGDLDGVARDASTLLDVIASFEGAGYRSQFVVRAEGRLSCVVCHREFAGSAAEVRAVRRLEGASDPDDMLAVAAIACPACASLGTVVLGYGPASSPEDIAVLASLEPPAPDHEIEP
jgi:hypothetical protein